MSGEGGEKGGEVVVGKGAHAGRRRWPLSLALRLCAHLDFFAQLPARAVRVLAAHGARRLGVGLVVTRQAGAGLGDGGNKFLFLWERAWGKKKRLGGGGRACLTSGAREGWRPHDSLSLSERHCQAPSRPRPRNTLARN